MNKCEIKCGDWVEVLKATPDNTFDLCVTSPPYDNLRTYGGHGDWRFKDGAKELFRCIKPGGVVCWNVGDATIDGSETLTSFRQAIFFKDDCGFVVHDTMIWQKLHVAAPTSVRYHQMFEFVFIMAKGSVKTFNPIKDRRNKWAGSQPFGLNSKRQTNGEIKKTAKQAERGSIADFGLRQNIWEGPSRAQENPCQKLDHPAMMPKWLARDLIISFSNPGDLVLDPFGGSGTVGVAALGLARDSVLIDINQEYCDLMRQQTSNATPGLGL